MQPFETYFSDYLAAIREAKEKGASHDYLRQVFIEFAKGSGIGVNHANITVSGSIVRWSQVAKEV